MLEVWNALPSPVGPALKPLSVNLDVRSGPTLVRDAYLQTERVNSASLRQVIKAIFAHHDTIGRFRSSGCVEFGPIPPPANRFPEETEDEGKDCRRSGGDGG